MAAAKRGACIVRQSLGLNVDVAELTMLGYNYRCGANLEPVGASLRTGEGGDRE